MPLFPQKHPIEQPCTQKYLHKCQKFQVRNYRWSTKIRKDTSKRVEKRFPLRRHVSPKPGQLGIGRDAVSVGKGEWDQSRASPWPPALARPSIWLLHGPGSFPRTQGPSPPKFWPVFENLNGSRLPISPPKPRTQVDTYCPGSQVDSMPDQLLRTKAFDSAQHQSSSCGLSQLLGTLQAHLNTRPTLQTLTSGKAPWPPGIGWVSQPQAPGSS